MLPKVEHIMANFCSVRFVGLTVYFSYSVPIAFQFQGNARVVNRNDWSNTTGRHLNYIEVDKKKRVDGETFARLWSAQFKGWLLDQPFVKECLGFTAGTPVEVIMDKLKDMGIFS